MTMIIIIKITLATMKITTIQTYVYKLFRLKAHDGKKKRKLKC
jgi:hypothetical protein